MKRLGVSRGQMEKGEVTATRIERTLYANRGKATILEAQETSPENPRSLWGREKGSQKQKQHPHSRWLSHSCHSLPLWQGQMPPSCVCGQRLG